MRAARNSTRLRERSPARRASCSRSDGVRDDVRAEAVVEIRAEAAGAQSRAARSRLVAAMILPAKRRVLRLAEALERARLQHAQELHLDRRLELADLVEEHGPVRRARLRASRRGPRPRR